jgi:hypothetical protein
LVLASYVSRQSAVSGRDTESSFRRFLGNQLYLEEIQCQALGPVGFSKVTEVVLARLRFSRQSAVSGRDTESSFRRFVGDQLQINVGLELWVL